MLVGNALLLQHLGRDWRWKGPGDAGTFNQEESEVSLFLRPKVSLCGKPLCVDGAHPPVHREAVWRFSGRVSDAALDPLSRRHSREGVGQETR